MQQTDYQKGYIARLNGHPCDPSKSYEWQEGWEDADNSITQGE